MSNELKYAVQKRIELGHSREQIIAELVATGYTEAVASQVYEEVAGGPAPIPKPTEPVPSPATPPADDNEPAAEDLTANLSTPTQGNFLPILIGVGLSVVIAVVAAAWMIFGQGGFSLFGGTPYVTESELLGGIVEGNRTRTAFGFNLDYEFVLEEQDPDSPTVSDTLFSDEELDNLAMMLQYTFSEGSAKFSASGLIDARDIEAPEFDISMQLNVLAEPFIINTAASLRAANGNLYGKIDKIPANLRTFLTDIPEETWIILEEASVIMPDDDAPVPEQALRLYDEFVPEVVKIYTDSLYQVALAGQKNVGALVQSDQSKQLASGLTAFGLDTSVSPEEREIVARSFELITEYPPIVFAEEVEKINFNDETVYQYQIDIDYDNLRQYYVRVTREAERISGESLELTDDELLELLPTRAETAELNRLTDINVHVRPDGTLAGIYFAGVLAFDHDEINSQLRVSASFSPTRQNDGLDIEPPEEVHPETLEEIMFSGPLGDARAAGNNASVKQSVSTVRAQAELYYNQNDFSYEGMCSQNTIEQLLSAAANTAEVFTVVNDSRSNNSQVTCNDSAQEYAVVAPLLPDYERAFCVDSTGFAGDVAPSTLATANTQKCGTRLPAQNDSSNSSLGYSVPPMQQIPEASDKLVTDTIAQIAVIADMEAAANAGNYGQVCTNDDVQFLLQALSQSFTPSLQIQNDRTSGWSYMVCNDSPEGFAVAVPAVESTEREVWCVDKMGIIGLHRSSALSPYTDVSCAN